MSTNYTLSATSFTIEAWVSNSNTASYWGDPAGCPAGTGWEAIVDLDNDGSPYRDFTTHDGSLELDDGAGLAGISGVMSGTAWTHVAARYTSGSPGPKEGFVNGTITGVTSTDTWTTTNVRVVVGAWASGASSFSDYWYGKIDEVRISNVARDACWIGTEYNNQSSARNLCHSRF